MIIHLHFLWFCRNFVNIFHVLFFNSNWDVPVYLAHRSDSDKLKDFLVGVQCVRRKSKICYNGDMKKAHDKKAVIRFSY